jgi:8-oxo-dGTP pyrophosphatase MutT (NUDIX family)
VQSTQVAVVYSARFRKQMERILRLQKNDTIFRCCNFQQKFQKNTIWYVILTLNSLVVYQSERKIEDSQENMLDFTKGKADEGESDIDCAVREISEEVGLDVRKYISEDHFIKVETI